MLGSQSKSGEDGAFGNMLDAGKGASDGANASLTSSDRQFSDYPSGGRSGDSVITMKSTKIETFTVQLVKLPGNGPAGGGDGRDGRGEGLLVMVEMHFSTQKLYARTHYEFRNIRLKKLTCTLELGR